jgi:predicted enzyme related to lactoylglutathione lyase
MMPIRAGVNGGLFKKTDQMTAEQAKPTNYIWVESVEEYGKQVEQLGGKIIVQDGDSWLRLVGLSVRP